MSSRLVSAGAALLLVAAAAAYGIGRWRHARHLAAMPPAVAKPAAPPPPVTDRAPLPKGATFAAFLSENFQIPANEAAEIVAAARPAYNLAHVRAGNPVTVVHEVNGTIDEVRYRIDADRRLVLHDEQGSWRAAVEPIAYETRVEAISATVQDSLIGAIEKAGEQDALALDLAQIFGWDLDFYTDPRAGDTVRVVVEKRYLNGQFAGYGRVLAAEYVNAGTAYEAVRFHDLEGLPAYFKPSGQPMKREFLRSPLKFQARVTSGFSYHRFHPILKIYRPHLGVDYAAPIGTPVQSIGSGMVIAAGWHGGGGREVKIRHANGYETLYLHLSRILVHVGQHVAQGQRIGLVGESGLATGPHLDFRIEHDGHFENFEVLRRRLPPAAPVPKSAWASFTALCARWLQPLEALAPSERVVMAASAAPNAAVPAALPQPGKTANPTAGR